VCKQDLSRFETFQFVHRSLKPIMSANVAYEYAGLALTCSDAQNVQ